MKSLNEVESIPPKLKRKLQRVEVIAGAAVVVLLVLTGLGYALGLFAEKKPETVFRETRFRPLVAAMSGEVDYKAVDSTAWRPLRLSDTFEEGDMIRSGPDSTCDVLLTWGTGFTIAPESEFLWKRLAMRGAALNAEFVLPRGKILATLDDLPEGSLIIVTTPHSTTEVKGTILDVEADEKATRTLVLRGLVEVVDRSNPTRRVQVGEDTKVAIGVDEKGEVETLTAEDRAKLLSEESTLKRRVDVLTPRQAAKGKLTFSAEEPQEAEVGIEVERKKTFSEQADDDRIQIQRIITKALTLLNRGRVEQTLGLCTQSFRAVIWGQMARRSGVAREFSRAQGDGAILAQRDVVQSAISLELTLQGMDVTIDGDVAYVNAVVRASANARSAGSGTVERNYSCSARLVEQDGRWLVDLATAMEGGTGR